MAILFKVLKWSIILSVFVFLIHCWLVTKSYNFTEEQIADFARKHIGKKPKTAFDAIYKDIKKEYPAFILPEEDLQWIFMNAGGWMGSVCILHASLTEYILFFGSAVDTVGHSGRYWANVSDTILTGEFRQWKEGELEAEIHKEGATVLHAWGEVTAVNFKAGTWMVEYGRGFIPSTLGFALADTFFSTQDFVTLFYILRVYTKALLQYFGTMAYWYIASLTNIGFGS